MILYHIEFLDSFNVLSSRVFVLCVTFGHGYPSLLDYMVYCSCYIFFVFIILSLQP